MTKLNQSFVPGGELDENSKLTHTDIRVHNHFGR